MKKPLNRGRKPTSPSNDMRKTVATIQEHLNAQNYEEALQLAANLENTLQIQKDAEHIYLTSIVWQVRALQGQNAPKDQIDAAALRYASESERLGDFSRATQGQRILAQNAIFAGDWDKAIEYLQAALDLAMKANDGRAVLEILMHIGGLELKLCHYMDAIDAISRAVNALDNSGMTTAEAAEFRAMGQRQLAELYDMIGAGHDACNALEAAQNANTKDPEEKWLQKLHFSRLDLRSGNAVEALKKLDQIAKDLQTALANGQAKLEQCQMVELERLQVLWNLPHTQSECLNALQDLETRVSMEPLQLAIALMRFQWLAEGDAQSESLQTARDTFEHLCEHSPHVDIQIQLAGALTSTALEIRKGHYEASMAPLRHIAETAAFTQLIPFATRALALRSQIYASLCQFSRAAVDARNACETFLEHVDNVAAKLTAAMMLCAQAEQTRLEANGPFELDEAELQAFAQLLEDWKQLENQKHITAFIDLGLELAKLCHIISDIEQKQSILSEISPYLCPEFAARRAKLEKLL